MARNIPTDPRRARIIELTQELQDRIGSLRDFTMASDSAWLAKGELQSISLLISDIESVVEEIQRYDAGEI